MTTRILEKCNGCGCPKAHYCICSDLGIPQIDEYWTIEYGLKKKHRSIVKVLRIDDHVKNWRSNKFWCNDEGDVRLYVSGLCFIDKWG